MQSERARRGNTRGFTLLELMVVLAVFVILVSAAMPKLITQKQNADRLERQRRAELVQKSLNQYFAYEGAFPDIGGVAFSAGNLSNDALCGELTNELATVTCSRIDLEAGYYRYNESTGAFALIDSH